jgi:MFS family permease
MAAAGGVWGREHRRLTAGLVLTISAIAFEALAVATVLPATVADLGGLEWYGWAFSGLLLTSILGATLGGRAADRRGPAPPFAVGVALFAAGLVVAGLAPSMPVLVAGRVVQGLGSGLVGAVAYVGIGRGYPGRLRPRMLAIQSSAWVVPGLVGPAAAGLLAERFGWRLVFLGLIPLLPLATALAVPALRRITPAPGRAGEPADRAELWRSARLAAGVAMLLAGLARPSPLGATGVVAGLLLAWQAGRRLLPRDGPGDPATIRVAVVVLGLLAVAFFGAETFLPLALNVVRHSSLATGGLVLTSASLTWTAGSWAQARLTRRGRRRSLVVAGLGVLVVALAGIAGVLVPGVPLLLAPVVWGLAGFGMGLANSTLNLVMLEAADPGRPGQASSLLQLGNTVGTALGTGFGGALVALGERLGWPTGTAVGIIDAGTVVVLLLALAVARRLPARARAADEPAAAGRI